MKRIGLWITIGLFALSLVYLFKPRSEKRASTPAVPSPPRSVTFPSPRKPRININAASVEQLASLPGIGSVMARRIVEYRKRHGPFQRPEDLLIIEGIGEKRFRALVDYISVEASQPVGTRNQ
ncbi:MAG: hypothetical protein D6723_12745 [Acidobacteria bacterium]|nr:MAG: hypothetical protein D6723_12745 [Acidobacteriota bacterium]